jgi:hypothetical protein
MILGDGELSEYESCNNFTYEQFQNILGQEKDN